MLDFLLKYSPVMFKEGVFTFRAMPAILWLLALVIVFVALLLLCYRRTTLEISKPFKGILLTFKGVALLLLILLLCEPVITVSTVVPRRSSLIVLVDDSESMTITDAGAGDSRLAYTRGLLGNTDDDGLLTRLAQTFKLQTFEFSDRVDPLVNANSLTADGEVTDLAAGLSFAVDMSKQNAISGVVLVTDGVDNGAADPLESAALLGSRKLPLYVVGVGDEKSRDLELAKVAVNRSVIENSVVELSALIKSEDIASQEVQLELREDGRIIKQQGVTLSGTGTRATLSFSPQTRGIAKYTLNVTGRGQETVTQNNTANFLIDNRKRKARVLYVEGYPRAEFKYLRRAIDGDPSLELISLLRTGPDKFYRQGIRDQSELRSGFPKDREQLFKYDAIILGSIEAAFFSEEDFENVTEFVSQRGGGFLMLGGGLALAQGGYSGTPFETLLPVELPYQNGSSSQSSVAFRDKYKLLLTPEGWSNSMLQLAANPDENRRLWEDLPDLESYNPLGAAKPGATVLAVHPLSETSNPKIIMANQRYGRGRSMVFATSSSWQWQMGMPHEDMSHERFWRQVLRWLSLAAPAQVVSHTEHETYTPGEAVKIVSDVRDSTFRAVEDAVIEAQVITPSGKAIAVDFNWSSNGKVAYVGQFTADEEGLHRVRIIARDRFGREIGRSESAFLVEPSKREFSNAQMQAPLLRRLAEVTGGKFYHQDEALGLPDEISVMKGSYSRLVEYDLWDMPLLFVLIILLLSVEWYVRRSRGLS